MTTPAPLPPRVAHNQKFYDEWMSQHGNPPVFPTISEQVELMPLNLRGLHPYAFNPSIIRFGGRLLIAYRYPIQNNILNTKLGIAELDDTWNAKEIKPVELNTVMGCDDPRLFVFNGSLFMCWVESVSPSMDLECQILYGGLEEHQNAWRVHGVMNPKLIDSKKFNRMEKNWVPFPHDNTMRFIYASSPKQVLLEMSLGQITNRQESYGLSWKWGPTKGGTTPIPWNDCLMRFFHSTLDNEPSEYRRRYFIGAMLMEPEPPHTIIRLSKKPIIYGSEAMPLPHELASKCPRYNPNRVVFPGGAIEHKDGWLLSFGVNDSLCAIAYIKPENLNL